MRSDDPGDVRDSLVFSRKVFAFGGLWPEKFIPLLPETIATYVGFHLVTEICALLYLLKLSQILLIVSTMEFIFMLTMCLLTLLIRFNKYLPPLISEMKRDIEGNKLFKNNDEKRLYLRYNAISYNFGKYYLTLQTLIVLLMFFRPLVHVLTHLRGHDNMTQPYRSPLVNYLFFDYTHNAGYYFLMFLWESPAMYVSILHMAGVSFIVSLSLHLCGKYSILSYRIRNVPTKPPHHFQVNIKKVVEQHLKLTELTRNLNDGLHLMLLVEYLSCTSRMGLSMYVVLITFGYDLAATINFIMYGMSVSGLWYLYSYVGEQLVFESQDLGDAMYDIDWPEMTNNDRKTLLMCLINGQQRQFLTAGKFYKFSLFGFTDMMKFSLACISMLQATME